LRGAAHDIALRPFARFRGDVHWWPALNGQRVRAATIQRLITAYDPDVLIETGTFRGASTAFFASFSRRVMSAEISPRHHLVARLRLWRKRNVTLAVGPSLLLLERLASQQPPLLRPFFYLDAHWGQSLPLREELDLIWSSWDDALVVIDDFKVPDDPGFGYDDYGEVGVVDVDYCAPPEDVATYVPAHAAEMETGFRRGTGYMGKGQAAQRLLEESRALRSLVT
jgi:hypothetical protein